MREIIGLAAHATKTEKRNDGQKKLLQGCLEFRQIYHFGGSTITGLVINKLANQ